MWTPIFFPFQKAHPERDFLFASPSDPLPDGFMGISLLDAANNAAREDENFKRPFNSPQGKDKLRKLLLGQVAEEFSYAHSATAR